MPLHHRRSYEETMERCKHNFPIETCYTCNGSYLRDRARRMRTVKPREKKRTCPATDKSNRHGTCEPIETPPVGTVNVYVEREETFVLLNGTTEYVRIFGPPNEDVIDRVVRLAPNIKKLFVGMRLELVGGKCLMRLARKHIAIVGSAR